MSKEEKFRHDETQRRLDNLEESVELIKTNHLPHIQETVDGVKLDVGGVKTDIGAVKKDLEWVLWAFKLIGGSILLGLVAGFLKVIMN